MYTKCEQGPGQLVSDVCICVCVGGGGGGSAFLAVVLHPLNQLAKADNQFEST